MKKITLMIALFFTVSTFSQNEDPNLVGTWYLTFLQSDDLAPSFTVSAISPPISPALTISEGFLLSGNMACNSFSGTFTNSNSENFQGSQIGATLLICDFPIYNSFEGAYFSFFNSQELYYSISDVEGGHQLMFTNALMGSAFYYDFPLGVDKFETEKIAVFPNPTRELLSVSNGNITKIEICNMSGQSIKTIYDNFENINVADFPSGIYMLKIATESGVAKKKFIKL